MVKLLNGSMKIGIQSEIQLKSWRLQFGKKNEEILVRVTYANIFFTGRG